MAKLKVGDILPWAVLIGGGYLIYTNWGSIQSFASGLFAGGAQQPQQPSSGGGGTIGQPIGGGGGGGGSVGSPINAPTPGGGSTTVPNPPQTGSSPPPDQGGVTIPPANPSTPSPSNPQSPATPIGPVTPPLTSDQQSMVNNIVANGRQYCIDNYCYKSDEVGAYGYATVIVSGPGITTPLLVTKAGRPAFTNGTGYIGPMCDSKNNCWHCDPTICLQISYEGGTPVDLGPTSPPGGQPSAPGSAAAPGKIDYACAQESPNWKAYSSASLQAVGMALGGDKAGAQKLVTNTINQYPDVAKCLGLLPATGPSQPGGGVSTTPSVGQPSQQPNPAGGNYSDLQILQAWDQTKIGKITDQDYINATNAWTEGRLLSGATKDQQDYAIRLIGQYWTTGQSFGTGGYTPGSQQVVQSVQTRIPAGYTPQTISPPAQTTPRVDSAAYSVSGGITAYHWSNGVWSYTYPNGRVAYRYPDGSVKYA